MKKKILALALVVVLAVTAVTGATLAYFTAEDEATNTFTVGNVAIDLIEPDWDAEGSVDAPEVYPGEALAKDPQVTNEGANPCFVRIKVEGLDWTGSDDDITLRWIDENNVYHDGYNTRDWQLVGDYYYYRKPLCVTGTEDDSWNANYNLTDATTELFSQIVIPTDLVNGDGTTEFDIDVTAYAVQAQGARASWAEVNSMTPEQIAEWFTTCGL